MMRTSIIFGALLVIAAATAVEIVSLRRTNTALQRRVDERRRVLENQTSMADKPFLRQADESDEKQLSGVQERARIRLIQLRAEVAAFEKQAAAQYAGNSEQTDAPSRNRDPEKGMTKLEYMQNVGQRTPAAALQTLFWAALKGEDKTMAETIGWDERAGAEAQRLIERLPAEMQARYPTPGALAALFISKYALDVSAIQISETVLKDEKNASLIVKGLTGRDEHLPMHLGANGWQLWEGEAQLKWLNEELTKKNNN